MKYIALIITVVALGVIAMFVRSISTDRDERIGEYVRRLESKDLQAGSQVLGPKGWVGVGRESETGDVFGMLAAWEEKRVLLLYTRNAKLYAACVIDRIHGYHEKWYFCDETLLVRHIRLAHDEDHARMGGSAKPPMPKTVDDGGS